MKIAYLLYLDVEKYDGVASKVVSQLKAWQSLGHEIKLLCVVPKPLVHENPLSGLGNHSKFFVEGKFLGASAGLISGWFKPDQVQKSILTTLSSFKPDIVYYRNTAYSSTIHSVNRKYKTVCEVNTKELSEYQLQTFSNLKYFFRFAHFLVFHRYSFNKVDAIVGVTYEIVREIKRMGYKGHLSAIPNSIDISRFIKRRRSDYFKGKIPKLVFIGTPGMAWHGIDRIIKIAERSIHQLEFHIIGYSKDAFPSSPENVKFYGVLPYNQTEKIISGCDIGFGTMALYRKKMEEACPLKVRECLAYGLPMILGYDDTAFFQNAEQVSVKYPDFILRLPNHQHDIKEDTEKILQFSKKYFGRLLSVEEVASYIDVEYLEKRRLDFLKMINGITTNK